MKRYGIVLITINALTSLFLMSCLANWIYQSRSFFNEEYWLLIVPSLSLILSLIYIWRTMEFYDQGLAALKVEKERGLIRRSRMKFIEHSRLNLGDGWKRGSSSLHEGPQARSERAELAVTQGHLSWR